MRRTLIAALLLLCLSTAATPADTPELDRARRDAARIRELVQAGALPARALEEAEVVLAEAQDEAVLERTLYSSLDVWELTPETAEAMVKAAERLVGRQGLEVIQARRLVRNQVRPESYLKPFEAELVRRQKTLLLAQERASLFEGVLEMARLEQELAEALAAQSERAARIATRFDGNGRFLSSQRQLVGMQFERNFGHPLPVSADGDTPLHRSLGFDHTGRLDVALHPDSEEGAWLLGLLESMQVPYFAFRGAVAGKATGAHIHIGPPSGPIHMSN
jgi:hypothetical protein